MKEIIVSELLVVRNVFAVKKDHKKLLVCVAGIGDLLLTLPSIKGLFKKDSKKIDVLVNKTSMEIVENNPFVDKVYCYNNGYICCRKDNYTIRGFLDKQKYNIVYSVRSPYEFMKEMLFSTIGTQWIPNPMYERARIARRLLSKVSTKVKKKVYGRAHVTEYLYQAFVGDSKHIDNNNNLFLPPPSREFIDMCDEIQPYILVHVAGNDNIRKLRSDFIVELCKKTLENIVLVGSKGDAREKFDELSKNDRVTNLIGLTNLTQLAYVIKESKVCIAPDSMVMHLASIEGTNLIALMGNALKETFGPYPLQNNQHVITKNPSCSPCNNVVCRVYNGYSCVQDISVAEMLDYLSNFGVSVGATHLAGCCATVYDN